MIKIVVEKNVKNCDREAFLKTVEPLVEGSRKEKGNISYQICADPKFPNKIFFIEEWIDVDYIIDIHCKTKHVLEIVPELEKFYFEEGTEYWTSPICINN